MALLEFPTLESSEVISVNLGVSLDQVDSLKTVEEAEQLYDKYSAEVEKNVHRVDTTEFSKAYPAKVAADSLGLAEKSTDYRNYVSRYNLKRDEAKKIWRGKKLSSVNAISKAIHAKLDSLVCIRAITISCSKCWNACEPKATAFSSWNTTRIRCVMRTA